MSKTHKQCVASTDPAGEVVREKKDKYDILMFFINSPGLEKYSVSYKINKPFGDLDVSEEETSYEFTETGYGLAISKYIEYRDLIDKNQTK
ncbi:hypothetical protein [Listeria monocytogenes]|uniref:hypothetical protein n=1 Tax=Listeria monocytogenes TaxID=1639 RepID=UPI000BE07FE8|nr:hypothetical protein [Listeria monocytogenes]EAC6624318.1 hypothetical protein [Listeria monocytogenes]EAC6631176.1 hypothetical protein [Listeria monocytogenes]EAC6633652.1 hypothetical protein [Listeria monocytogenes]EAD6088938.1 hypothetical protein [Listeria monocytogenes]EAD6092176.1 hypothetical protein [Listeria monocytogenes]